MFYWLLSWLEWHYAIHMRNEIPVSIFEQSITRALVFTHSIIRRAVWSYNSLAACRCKCSIIQVTEDKSFNLAREYSHHTPVTECNSSRFLVLFLTEKAFREKSKRSPNKTMHVMDWSFWKQSIHDHGINDQPNVSMMKKVLRCCSLFSSLLILKWQPQMIWIQKV